MQDYHQLEVWNRSMDNVVRLYDFIASLPTEEKFNIASQLRRAVVSAPLNIAEGSASATNAEFGGFLGFAYRSLKEVICALELCQRLYPSVRPDSLPDLIDESNQISRMIHGLIQRIAPTESRWPEPDPDPHS